MTSPPANLQIRPMTPTDLGRVMQIAQSLDQAPRWPLQAWNAALDPQATPRRLALVAEDPAPHQDASLVVGFAVASLLPPQVELETIAVNVEHQRRGIGRRLFAAIIEELGRAQVTEVRLEVRASNLPALEFYHSQGFAEAGRRPRYYIDPVEDAVLLSLNLA